MSVVENVVTDATKERPRQLAHASGSHDDDVGILLASNFHKHLSRFHEIQNKLRRMNLREERW